MSDLTVANTIAKQLGGTRRLSAMIGAKNFTGDDNSLKFSFKGSKKANLLKVTLNSSDLYDMTFCKVRKFDFEDIREVKDVFCEDMKQIFERMTGLYLSL